MKYIFTAIILLSIFSCKQKESNSQIETKDSARVISTAALDEYLITDTSFGKINTTLNYRDLENIFGKNNLQDTISYAAEGLDSFTVTKIFSNTPKEVVINWRENQFHKVIGTVECYQENSLYHTADSLKVGSTLKKLMEVNGKKINFYGTGWDYGGLITSYNNGKFHKSNLFFSLNSRDDAGESVYGDRELNTDQPSVKANITKLYISKISLSLHQ